MRLNLALGSDRSLYWSRFILFDLAPEAWARTPQAFRTSEAWFFLSIVLDRALRP